MQEETQLRQDWEAKLARINVIKLFTQASREFPLVNADRIPITRPLTAAKIDDAYSRLADPSNPYEPAVDEDDENYESSWIEFDGTPNGETPVLYVQAQNEEGELLYEEGFPQFRLYTSDEYEQDQNIGELPRFLPSEKAVFIKNFEDIWGVHPATFTGEILTFENGDQFEHHPIYTREGEGGRDGRSVFLESTGEMACRPWFPGFTAAYCLEYDAVTGDSIKDIDGLPIRIPVDEDSQVQFATFSNYKRTFHQFSKEYKEHDRVCAERILRAIEDQKRRYKLLKAGNSLEIAIDNNHVMAPTAHIITTGAPNEQYIFTSDSPPPFGCPLHRPVEPKLKDINSMSVQEEVGVMFDNGTVRTSRTQGLITRSGNAVYYKCSRPDTPKYSYVDSTGQIVQKTTIWFNQRYFNNENAITKLQHDLITRLEGEIEKAKSENQSLTGKY